MSAAEALDAVVAELREAGSISAEEPYTHSVPFSHRSGERIEPLISLQWFCAMDELAKPAIAVVESDEVRITPERWKRVYLDWMEGIRPWCVSRQLWWGHQLPVWYCDACEKTIVEETEPESCPTAAARCGATPTCSTPGSARRCGRSRRSAGPRTRPSCAPSTRPTCSRRPGTSSTSGSRG